MTTSVDVCVVNSLLVFLHGTDDLIKVKVATTLIVPHLKDTVQHGLALGALDVTAGLHKQQQ